MRAVVQRVASARVRVGERTVGEIGHGLIARLASANRPIVTIDIAPLEPALEDAR